MQNNESLTLIFKCSHCGESNTFNIHNDKNQIQKSHNDINKNVKDFLKSYKTNKEECIKEINAMKEEAKKLYEEINNEDIKYSLLENEKPKKDLLVSHKSCKKVMEILGVFFTLIFTLILADFISYFLAYYFFHFLFTDFTTMFDLLINNKIFCYSMAFIHTILIFIAAILAWKVGIKEKCKCVENQIIFKKGDKR